MSTTSFPVSADTRPAIQNIEALITAFRKAGKEVGMTDKQIEDMTRDVRRLGNEGSGQVNNLGKQFDNFTNNTLKRAGGALAAFFAIDQARELLRRTIEVTSQFQKLAAVLTNTLGSKSQAQIALANIAKFAASTPFSVRELTESFVKLANMGFVPTSLEMRKLGDLASSTGKQFDMLVEAIIDAQTGEFERLKEFGIRASKQGDQVTFSFKNVKTQVDFTSESIRNYILSLGDAEGVSGSMAAISKTLGGELSNLGDELDSFFNTLGEGNSGVLSEFIGLMKEAIVQARELIKTDDQRLNEVIGEKQAAAVEAFKEFSKGYTDMAAAKEAFFAQNEVKLQQLNEEFSSLRDIGEQETTLFDKMMGNTHAIDLQNKARREKLDQLSDEIFAYTEIPKAIEDYIAALEKQNAAQSAPSKKMGLIEGLEKQIKEIEDLKKTASSIDEIARLNDQLYHLQSRLKLLKNAGEDLVQPFDEGVFSKFFADNEKRMDKEMKGVYSRFESTVNKILEKDAEEKRKRLENERTLKQQKEELWEQSVVSFATIYGAYMDYRSERNASELAALQEQESYEIEAAGTNARAREKIERDSDKKQRALKREQAERDKNQALFNIALSTAQGVMSALASLPPNVPLSLFIGFTGLAQAAFVSARKPPAFKDGVYDLDGPGTSTSDSIPAFLSKGESVVPTNKHGRFGFIIKEIIENPSLDLFDVRNMIDQKLPSGYANIVIPRNAGTDSPELLNELRATRRAIENKPSAVITVDEDGFSLSIQRGNNWTTYVNKRYKREI